MKKILVTLATVISVSLFSYQTYAMDNGSSDLPSVNMVLVDGIGEYWYSEDGSTMYIMCSGIGTCIQGTRNPDGSWTLTIMTKDGPCTINGSLQTGSDSTMPGGLYSVDLL